MPLNKLPLNKLLALLFAIVALQLGACSSKPVSETPAKPAPVLGPDGKPLPAQKKIDPKAKALFQSALKAIEQGNTDEAIRLLNQMASDYPKLSGSHTNLGLIYLKQNDLGKAEAAFQQALAIRDDNAIAHNHLGIIYRQQGKFTAAEKAYLKAIEQDASYANAHLNLGILYDIYLRKLNKALQHYQAFQAIQGIEDKTVTKWIVGLKRRIKTSK